MKDDIFMKDAFILVLTKVRAPGEEHQNESPKECGRASEQRSAVHKNHSRPPDRNILAENVMTCEPKYPH